MGVARLRSGDTCPALFLLYLLRLLKQKGHHMPFVMLHPGRPGNFRRTILRKKKPVQLTFERNKPVELSAADCKQLDKDLGHALVPVEFDEKDKARPIFDLVEQVEDEVKPKAEAKADAEAKA